MDPEAPVRQHDEQMELDRILKIRVPVIVTLAHRKLSLEELLKFTPGQVVEFEKPANQPVEIAVNNRAIGYGDVVVVGDKFGLKLQYVGPMEEIVTILGAT